MDSSPEKRREERFQMELAVSHEDGAGLSRDISGSGIYFVTDRPPVPGGTVKFSVKFDHIRPGRPLRLDCRGVVLRVEQSGDQFGVAATINEFWCTH